MKRKKKGTKKGGKKGKKEGRKNKKEGKKEEKEVNVQSRWISLEVLVYTWRGWFELICIGGWINKTREGKVVACLLARGSDDFDSPTWTRVWLE